MRTIPKFLRGSYRNALRVVMEEALHPLEARRTRGWKLFLLLPRMLLHRPPRGGNIPKRKLAQRFDDFSGGSWARLLEASGDCDEHATVAQRRKRRRDRLDVDATCSPSIVFSSDGRTVCRTPGSGRRRSGTWERSHSRNVAGSQEAPTTDQSWR